MRANSPRLLAPGTLFSAALATLLLVCTAVLVPQPAAAQGEPRVEIGTSAGVTINTAGGSSETHIGIPGGIGSVSTFSPMMYATIFEGVRSLVGNWGLPGIVWVNS